MFNKKLKVKIEELEDKVSDLKWNLEANNRIFIKPNQSISLKSAIYTIFDYLDVSVEGGDWKLKKREKR